MLFRVNRAIYVFSGRLSVKNAFIRTFTLIFFAFIIIFTLSSCASGSTDRLCEVTEVIYDTKNECLSIKATLDARALKQYKHEMIYLIEVPANNTSSDITTLIPVSQTKPAKEMNFSLPLKNGAQTSLYSGFVLATFDRVSGYNAIGNIRYIDNPEVLAKNTSDYPLYSSAKGLNIVSTSDAVLLGVKHTVIRVPVEKYIVSKGSENSIAVTFDGVGYCLDSDMISELDYKIKNMTDAGIEVYLEFTLDTSPEELDAENALLASKSVSAVTENVVSGADRHYAISVSTGEGYRKMAAFFDFIASRYTRSDGKYGFAGAYIIGHGVNSLSDTGIDDPRTLADSAERCVKLLRVASTALRSNYKNGKIFVSLDGKWNITDDGTQTSETSENVRSDDLPRSLCTEFGAKEYITELVKNADVGGSFDFGVALMPLPSEDTSYVWNDARSTASDTSERITVCNLSLMTSLLDAENMMYNGKKRELMIYNYGISALDGNAQAASYAYAYYKVAEAGIGTFIYNGHWDGTTGNGMTGLYSTGEDGEAEAKRPIYEVLKNIDVKGSNEPFSATSLIGTPWKNLYGAYSEKVKTLSVSETTGSTSQSDESGKKQQKFRTKLLFDFSDGETHGFFPSDSAKSMDVSDFLGTRVLRAELEARYKGEKMGVRSTPVPYETLKKAKQLIAVIKADTTEGNTAKVTLCITQSGASESILFSSDVSVQAGNRQTVYFDLSALALDEKLGDVTLYFWTEANGTRSSFYSGTVNNNNDNDYDDGDGSNSADMPRDALSIESISVTSLAKGKTVLPIIIFIIIVAAAFVFFGYKYYLTVRERKMRNRNRRRPSRPMPYGGQNRGNMNRRPPTNGRGTR